MDILTINGKRKGGEIQDDIRSARGKSGSSRRPGLQGTSRRLPKSVSSRWKRLGKLLICSQRSLLKVEDRAVGKKATAFSSETGTIQKKGAIYAGPGVAVDGRIVTGDGPQSARRFGQEIVKMLAQDP